MNKTLYKLEILCVKYIPIIISLVVLLLIILKYFNILFELFNYIAGTSILTIIPMYVSSYTYRFCWYHRMFIHYLLVYNILIFTEDYFSSLIADLLILFMIIAGAFIFLITYYHRKYSKIEKNE